MLFFADIKVNLLCNSVDFFQFIFCGYFIAWHFWFILKSGVRKRRNISIWRVVMNHLDAIFRPIVR